jgi:hypothetical protein
MAITHEHPQIPAAPVEACAARARTSSALGDPRPRVTGATAGARGSHRLTGAALLCLAAGLAGCEPYVQGNGVYYEEQRQGLGAFTGVAVDSGIQASVTAGAAATAVTVSGDANVVPHLETQVRTDGERQVLHVWISTNFSGTIPPRAVVQLPVLAYAAATRAARIDGRQLGASGLEVDADRASAIVLQGATSTAADAMDVKLASGATLDATGYAVSGPTTVDLSGGSVARLHADGPVTGTVKDTSQLDDTAGAGSCAGVTADATAKVTCR